MKLILKLEPEPGQSDGTGSETKYPGSETLLCLNRTSHLPDHFEVDANKKSGLQPAVLTPASGGKNLIN